MQIALDTVVYIILTLMLFSLVLASLPKIESMAETMLKPPIEVGKEELVQTIIDVYLGKKDKEVVVLKTEITKEELEEELERAGFEMKRVKMTFEKARVLTVYKDGKDVIING